MKFLVEFTKDQGIAFKNAAGVLPANVAATLSAMIMMVALVWLAWVSFNLFQGFAKGENDLYDLIWGVVRGVIVILLLAFFIRP